MVPVLPQVSRRLDAGSVDYISRARPVHVVRKRPYRRQDGKALQLGLWSAFRIFGQVTSEQFSSWEKNRPPRCEWAGIFSRVMWVRVLVGRLPGRARLYNCWRDFPPYYVGQRSTPKIRILVLIKMQAADSILNKVSFGWQTMAPCPPPLRS